MLIMFNYFNYPGQDLDNELIEYLIMKDVIRGTDIFKQFWGCLGLKRKDVIWVGPWTEEESCDKRN